MTTGTLILFDTYTTEILSFSDVDALRNTLKVKIEDTVRTWAGQKYKNHSIEALLGIWRGVVREYGTKEELDQFN
ncbi:MAG TPA: hypothetical protein IAA29_11100 [Candidatus Paenibacillus intestinavium]|nr:hypothetical protein [Candidatus Paenibacillus intestinavium]